MMMTTIFFSILLFAIIFVFGWCALAVAEALPRQCGCGGLVGKGLRATWAACVPICPP